MSKMKWCPYCRRMVGLRKEKAPWGVAVFAPIVLFFFGIFPPLMFVLWPLAVLCSLWGHLGLKSWCAVCSAPGKALLPDQPAAERPAPAVSAAG